MTELDQLISSAYASNGEQEKVNKVYLTLLRSSLFIPIEKPTFKSPTIEDFKPLFAKVDQQYFILAFDTLERLQQWAGKDVELIDHIELNGRAFISGISEGVYLCLNLGEKFYKEFSPDEVKHVKGIIARINQLKGEV